MPPKERLNQVRNYRLILHRYYSNLNVRGIILEKVTTAASNTENLRKIEGFPCPSRRRRAVSFRAARA